MAKQTIARFIEKASRLYEQERNAVLDTVEIYIRQWVRWARSGLVTLIGVSVPHPPPTEGPVG